MSKRGMNMPKNTVSYASMAGIVVVTFIVLAFIFVPTTEVSMSGWYTKGSETQDLFVVKPAIVGNPQVTTLDVGGNNYIAFYDAGWFYHDANVPLQKYNITLLSRQQFYLIFAVFEKSIDTRESLGFAYVHSNVLNTGNGKSVSLVDDEVYIISLIFDQSSVYMTAKNIADTITLSVVNGSNIHGVMMWASNWNADTPRLNGLVANVSYMPL